jgi:hypothetical protein
MRIFISRLGIVLVVYASAGVSMPKAFSVVATNFATYPGSQWSLLVNLKLNIWRKLREPCLRRNLLHFFSERLVIGGIAGQTLLIDRLLGPEPHTEPTRLSHTPENLAATRGNKHALVPGLADEADGGDGRR